MKMSRIWAMPNSETFTIKPIKELIERELTEGVWIDPFVRNSIFKDLMTYTNDINPAIKATHNLEALEFFKLIEDNSVDGLLFDPPYSNRQVKECYEGIGRPVTMYDTQSPWTAFKKEIARVVKSQGKVIRCGWNSGGIGKNLDFEMKEVLLVPHGGNRNDTIVTVDYKL
jgi:hypothetical protein